MKSRISIRVDAILAIACMLFALEVTRAETADPFAVAATDQAPEISEPDFLIPVDPHPGDGLARYADQLSKHLGLKGDFEIRMVELPSFTGESVIFLQKKGASEGSPRETYRLVYCRCSSKSNIWYSMPENNREKKQKKVTIEKTTAEVTPELAERVEKVWKRMLLRTHYDPQGSGGLDGVTYEFSTWTMHGETWSPSQRKSPLLFIEVGHSLMEFCKADGKGKPEARKAVEEKLTDLEKYLDAHP